MELITILIMCLIIILVLLILLKFTSKNIKLIKNIGQSSKLNEMTNVLPENEEICKQMLAMLKNENVNIKSGNENTKASLYIVATNSIIIANIKNTFTRVQTIAHECLHSVQDKRLLWFNFLFSNVYIIYFITITILTLLNIINTPNIFAIILIMMSILLFFVRSYLETDAMTKAKFLAKQYMEKNTNIINKKDIYYIIENYDKINELGIKYTNFSLLFNYITKICIYCVVGMI